jgi:hypothetical protein
MSPEWNCKERRLGDIPAQGTNGTRKNNAGEIASSGYPSWRYSPSEQETARREWSGKVWPEDLGRESIATFAAAPPAAVPAPSTAVPTPSATTAASLFARASFVDGQRASTMILAVQPLDGRLRFFVTAHLDEAKPFASAALAVLNYLGALHITEATKQLLQIRAADAVAQVPDVQLLSQDQSP